MPEESESVSKMSEIYTALIWPPAAEFAEEIEQEVSLHYKIHKSTLYRFSDEKFKKFVTKVYKPDQTPPKRIKRKYKVMARFPRFVKLVEIEIDVPTMMPHKKTRLKGKFFCQEMKVLKKVIRTIFSPKVEGYIYDVVFHVSDNEDHNRRNRKLFKKLAKKVVISSSSSSSSSCLSVGLAERVKHIELLDELGLPKDQYIMTGSVWLAIMGIRDNKDIDIIITDQVREEYQSYLEKLTPSVRAEVQAFIDPSKKHSRRIVDIAKAQNADDLIRNHHVNIDGYQVVKYRLFKKYKVPRKGEKHKADRKAMDRFFQEKKDRLPEYKGVF